MAASGLAMARLPLALPRHDEAAAGAITSPSHPPLLPHRAANPPRTAMQPLSLHHHRVHACSLHLYAVAGPVHAAFVARMWSRMRAPVG